jgi:hypothetical protein
MAADNDIAKGAAAEIRDLHVFLVGWLGGALPRNQETFADFAGVMAPGFVIISPNGAVTRRDDLLTELEAAHGARGNVEPPFTIRIEKITPAHVRGDLALVAYQEWQDLPAETTARQSSALFGRAPDARHGVHWLHLHETWIAGHAPTV